MSDLNDELIKRILTIFRSYITVSEKSDDSYKLMGHRFIKFAAEYPNYFKAIFMSEGLTIPKDFLTSDMSYDLIKKHASYKTGLNDQRVEEFHLKMWIFCHGIASLIATKTCKFSEEKIDNLLKSQYKALMLLESVREKDEKCN